MLRRGSGRNLGKLFYVFFFLYFVQGIPYGFQTKYLPILFRMNGMDIAQVGLFKLLMVPWLFKPFWAGLVDTYFSRKFWLNGCLLILCLLCLIASFVPPGFVMNLAVVMFLFNVVTSIQDIALDSVVIESLTPLQLAQGNIAQVVGYKSGGLFSGGVFSLLSGYFHWKSIFYTIAGTYIIGLLVSLLFLPDVRYESETRENHMPESNGIRQEHSGIQTADRSISSNGVKCYLSSLIQTNGTIWILVFSLIFKMDEIGATNMYPMFLLDKGVSSHMTGFWTAFIGQAVSLFGSVLGGLINPGNLYSTLNFEILLRSLSIMFIFLGIWLWDSYTLYSYALSVLGYQLVLLIGGAVTTTTYTLAMSLSQMATRRCRASHYTLVTTSDVLGRLLFAAFVAGVTQWLGYKASFLLFSISSCIVIFQLSLAPATIRNQ